MTYFIDFFGTAFNVAEYQESGKTPEDDLSSFLYPDAARFLRDKENAAMIITSASKEEAGSLIRAALRGIPRIAVMYTEGVRKGEYLAPHISMYGPSPVFVDDSLHELESMSALIPGVRTFELRREGEGDGRWPMIRSLQELP